MKKGIKYLIVGICAVFLAIFTFLFIDFCFADFSFNGFVYGGKWKSYEKVYEASEVLSLKIGLYKGSFTVKTSTDGKIKLEYNEGKKCSYSFTEKDGEITIRQVSKRLFFPISFRQTKYDAVLYLPENYGGDLKTSVSDGNVFIEETSFEDLDVSCGTGNVTLKNILSSSIKATARKGNLFFDNIDGNIITLSSEKGNVQGTLPFDISEYTVKSVIKNKGKCNLPESTYGGKKYLTVQIYTGNINITFLSE